MDGSDLELACSCGRVRGEALGITSARVNHLVCMCDDCQAYAHHLGQAGRVLDRHGGTEVFQTVPARVHLTAGQEHVRCLRLTPRGLARWYSDCCKTPLGNTMASPRVPFVGVMMTFAKPSPALHTAIGPIVARTQGRFGHGELPADASRIVRPGFMLQVMARLAVWALRRQHRPHPFFAEDGTPIVAPQVLSHEQREALRPLCAVAPT